MGKPRIALAMGDAPGVSPELAAKVLSDRAARDCAATTVMGDARVLEAGARVADVPLEIEVSRDGGGQGEVGRPLLVDLGHCDPADIPQGQVSEASGRFATENFRRALAMAASGEADTVCFTPFNKAAMRLVTPDYDDEIGFTAATIGFQGIAKSSTCWKGYGMPG